ncbi:MAG: carbohydrate ABC transporter permease [Spirochaetales bacterium]|nr:carbohydrate ABC transporter permease [Spirochaetales bacterium]
MIFNRKFSFTDRGILSPLEMNKPSGRFYYIIFFFLLTALALTWVFPLYWMYSSGLKSSLQIVKFPPDLIPPEPNWKNYLRAWKELQYARYFSNTLILAFGAWALQIVISSTAAYSLSKLRPLFGNIVFFLFLSTLMVPAMAYLIPQYLTIVRVPLFHFTLLDSWMGVLLPQAANAFNIFLLKSFFDDIPRDLTDAARIDGASSFQSLKAIILPLSKPVLSVITIFTVIGTWKDFFWPYLVLSGRPELHPIMVALYRMTIALSYPQPLNIQLAGMAITATPPLILFFIFQKQIIRGITLTGLKG